MTKLEMKFDYQRKLREFRKKKKQEVDEEISKILSRWAIGVGGSMFVLGAIAGRLAR